MKPADLLAKYAEATSHPFLEAVRDGSLSWRAFVTWLVQDYGFVYSEFTA